MGVGRCPGMRFSGWGEKKIWAARRARKKIRVFPSKMEEFAPQTRYSAPMGCILILMNLKKFSANAGRDPFSLLLYLITGLSSVNINGWGRGATEGHFFNLCNGTSFVFQA